MAESTDMNGRDEVGVKRGASSPRSNAHKKLKLEEKMPEANPDTIEAVKDKNHAMQLDMMEKNRRLQFLAQKCETLYRRSAISDATLRTLRSEWIQLVDDLVSLLPQEALDSQEDWDTVLNASDSELVDVNRMYSKDVKLCLPDWFLSISRNENKVELPSSHDTGAPSDSLGTEQNEHIKEELEDDLKPKRQAVRSLLQKLLTSMNSQEAMSFDSRKVLEEKRKTSTELLRVKEELQVYKQQIRDLEDDMEKKETERHRACRDLDRLQSLVDAHALQEEKSSDANGQVKEENTSPGNEKQSPVPTEQVAEALKDERKQHELIVGQMQEDAKVLSDKLHQERSRSDELKREIDKWTAAELAWKKEEASIRQDHADRIHVLEEEKKHMTDEFNKIRYKAKDIEKHVAEKWKKKMSKLQTDLTKAKTHADELHAKNSALREKVATCSSMRDELVELKSLHEALAREKESLKTQVEREKKRSDEITSAVSNSQLETLKTENKSLVGRNEELQSALDNLRATEGKSADDKLRAALEKQEEMDERLARVQEELSQAQKQLVEMEKQMKEAKANEEAAREENDALLAEIDTIGQEQEAAVQAKKKLTQQLEEKRSAVKKLTSQVAKEEQAKSHCFEELTSARLEVSSLKAVHKQQKSTLESSKEALNAKVKELETLQAYVHKVEEERDAAAADRVKSMQEATTTKHVYTQSLNDLKLKQQQVEAERQKPCEQCDSYRRQKQRAERLLADARSSHATGEVTDLERLELRDLQNTVKCSVCQDRRKDVIISKCFHMFCRECVEGNLKSRNRKCPTCKKMFGQDDVKAIWLS